MDWKEPFRIAFEFGMWSLGWLLVLFVGVIVFGLAYALVAALVKTVTGKGKKTGEVSPEEDLESWAKSKSLKIIKNKDN